MTNTRKFAGGYMGGLKLLSIIIPVALIAAQSVFAQRSVDTPWSPPRSNMQASSSSTTYERLLPLANAGDTDIQNVLGYMYFHGEGVDQDYRRAHEWFHRSAEQGNLLAQRNLGLMHAQSVPGIPLIYFDPVEANFWFSNLAAGAPDGPELAQQSYEAFVGTVTQEDYHPFPDEDLGKNVYVTFCAGCHGFNGEAPYQKSPSFARGERLARPGSTLLDSIMNGLNSMPAWRYTLTEAQAQAVLAYVQQRFGGDGQNNAQLQPTQIQNLQRRHGELLELGEKTYLKYCSGCHGFNGISYYVNSPSFALGNRMEKSDAGLAQSIRDGRGVMPAWENMLHPGDIDALIRFIRTLQPAYESGIDSQLRVAPDTYFMFTPMGERGERWHNPGHKDPAPPKAPGWISE